MATTYLSLHYRVVSSTKHRQPLIHEKVIDRLHELLVGITKGCSGWS